MFKKLLKILGSFFLVLIVLLVGVSIWFGINASKNTDIARPYFETHLPAILSWDYQRLAPLLTPSMQEQLASERGDRFLRLFAKLGTLQSYEQLQYVGANTGVSTDEGAFDLSHFTLLGHFDAGDARISIVLAKTGDQYLVHGLNIQSDVFLE